MKTGYEENREKLKSLGYPNLTTETHYMLLKKIGFPDFQESPCFKNNQEDIISNILIGNDVIAVMPTGGGKSLCFQYTAALFHCMGRGTTIVVSPLVSLMEDQINKLSKTKIPAAMLSASRCTDTNNPQSSKDMNLILDRAQSGTYALLYVSTERLLSHYFIHRLLSNRLKISMVTVDEAHCINMWGFDFREDYLRIPQFINQLESRPQISAFTATASISDQQCIQDLLGMKTGKSDGKRTYTLPVNKIDYDRPNLDLFIQEINFKPPKNKSPKIKRSEIFIRKGNEILTFLSKNKGKNGIIFFNTIHDLDSMFKFLDTKINTEQGKHEYGFQLYEYYSTVQSTESVADRNEQKEVAMAAFTSERNSDLEEGRLMLATSAFGMGVDEDIDFVLHFDPPASVEEYYQEVGRAGRENTDNKNTCPCVLYYAYNDFGKMKIPVKTWRTAKNIYSGVGSAMSAGNLERNILQSYLQTTRLEEMKALLLQKAEFKDTPRLMDRILLYFRQTNQEQQNEKFEKFCWDLFKTLLDFQKPTRIYNYLKSHKMEEWEPRLEKDLKNFTKMLKTDMGAGSIDDAIWDKALSSDKPDLFYKILNEETNKDSFGIRTWEHAFSKKLLKLQEQKNCLYYNNTNLVYKLLENTYNNACKSKKDNKRKWFWIRTKIKAESSPLYTLYYIEGEALTWFDLMVANAAYTLWVQKPTDEDGNIYIYIGEIVGRLTGNINGCGQYGKHGGKNKIGKEIGNSLKKLSKDIKICFPTDKKNHNIFTFQGNKRTKSQNDDQSNILYRKSSYEFLTSDKNPVSFNESPKEDQFKPLLPCIPVKENGKVAENDEDIDKYKLTGTPLLYQYAEYLNEISSLTTDQLHITDENAKPLSLNFQNIKIQVYVAIQINAYLNIINTKNTSNWGKRINLKKNISIINLYRCENDKKDNARYLNEILQLNTTEEERLNYTQEKVRNNTRKQKRAKFLEQVMKYEIYMGFIEKFKLKNKKSVKDEEAFLENDDDFWNKENKDDDKEKNMLYFYAPDPLDKRKPPKKD